MAGRAVPASTSGIDDDEHAASRWDVFQGRNQGAARVAKKSDIRRCSHHACLIQTHLYNSVKDFDAINKKLMILRI